jgi:hypothetical protein
MIYGSGLLLVLCATVAPAADGNLLSPHLSTTVADSASAPPAASASPVIADISGLARELRVGQDSPDSSGTLACEAPCLGPLVWGIIGLRGYAFGQQVAPNGLEFNPLFSFDSNLNVWIWRDERIYAFADTRFWGQKAAPGVTNSTQGIFDFSKREFDLDLGAAWNYYGLFEARAFAYSFNNLNRGSSGAYPSGYNDGVGLENRLYFGGSYPYLGLPGFDVSRSNFVSAGYYPTKDMIDCAGRTFKPGPFAHAYVTVDLIDAYCWYLYLDAEFIGTRSFGSKLLQIDAGTAIRPFSRAPYLEFRLGSEDSYDLQYRETETSLYVAVRITF